MKFRQLVKIAIHFVVDAEALFTQVFILLSSNLKVLRLDRSEEAGEGGITVH